MPRHLLVDISSHGFGHLAQTAPVLNALRRRRDLRITVRCGIPREVLAARIDGDFDYVPRRLDFGLRMDNAVDVQVERSRRDYAEFHRNWAARVEREAGEIRRLAPDLLLANVPYLAIAAAHRASVPAIALCSLHWADIYRTYFGRFPEAECIVGEMLAAYRSALLFLQPQPSMPMPNLPRRAPIGVIARRGLARRDEIRRRFEIPSGDRIVLVALGGIPMRLDVDFWPPCSGVHFLVPEEWQAQSPHAHPLEALGLPLVDVLRSCDALIGKPGYGTFAEAAVNGVPALYLPRPDWPEEPYLVAWLEMHGRCLRIDRDRLERGLVADPLEILLALPPKPAPEPSGAEDAAEILAKILG